MNYSYMPNVASTYDYYWNRNCFRERNFVTRKKEQRWHLLVQ